MPRGGARPGSGPKKGAKYRKRFQLKSAPVAPGHKSTAAERHRFQQDLVAALVAQDIPEDAIAEIMGLSVDDLKAVFTKQLRYGRAIVKAKITASLLAGVDADNVPAARKLDELVSGISPAPAPKKLGKKEAALAAAKEGLAGGSKFAPLPEPGTLGALLRNRANDAINEDLLEKLRHAQLISGEKLQ